MIRHETRPEHRSFLNVLEAHCERYGPAEITVVGFPKSGKSSVSRKLFSEVMMKGLVHVREKELDRKGCLMESRSQLIIYTLKGQNRRSFRKEMEIVKELYCSAPVVTVLYGDLKRSESRMTKLYQEARKSGIEPVYRIDPPGVRSFKDQSRELQDWITPIFNVADDPGDFIDMDSSFQPHGELENKRVMALKKIVPCYTAGAIAIGAIPIPFSDALLLIPEQTAMAVHILSLFGADNVRKVLSPLISSTVMSLVGRSVSGSLLKMIPGIGTIAGATVTGAIAGACTYALGAAVTELGYRYEKSKQLGYDLPISQFINSDELKSMTKKFLEKLKNKTKPLLLEGPTENHD